MLGFHEMEQTPRQIQYGVFHNAEIQSRRNRLMAVGIQSTGQNQTARN